MATIAPLAIKVLANISDVTKNVNSVVSSITQMEKTAQRAAPSIKGLEDAAQGFGIAMEAVNAARSNVGGDMFGGMMDEQLEAMRKMESTAEVVFEANVRGASAAAAEIAKLPPTIQSAEAAMNALNTAMQTKQQAEGMNIVGDLTGMNDAIKAVGASTEHVVKGMAVNIQSVAPEISNLGNAFSKLNEVRDTAATFQMLTGDMNSMRDALAQGERSFDAFAVTAANSISQLPPKMESVKQSIDFFKDLQTQTESFQIIPPDAIRSLDVTKEKIAELARLSADGILDMNPSMGSIFAAQKEIEKLKALAEEMRAQTGDMDFMADAVAQAEANLGQLAQTASEVKMEMNGLQSAMFAFNNAPFTVLSNVFSDILLGMKNIGKEFNEQFGGMPARFAQITAGVSALIIATGILSAKMTALGISTSYFMSLWQSSMIYKGLGGIITLLNTWLGTQIAINVQTTAWVGIATLGIGALVALLAVVVMQWNDQSAAISESKASMEALADSTQKTIDKFHTLNNAAKSALEGLMTPAEKLVNKLKEITAVQNGDARKALREQMRLINNRQQELAGAIGNKKNQGWFADTDLMKSLTAEFKSNEEQFKKLKAALGELVELTAEQAGQAKENARIDYLKTTYGNLLEQTLTAQEEYANVLGQLAADTAAGRITTAEQDTVIANAKKKLIDGLGIGEFIKPVELPTDILAKNIVALNTALADGAITQEQFNTGLAAAGKKLIDGLGIGELIKPVELPTDVLAKNIAALTTAFSKGVITQEKYNIGVANAYRKLADGLGITEYLKDAETPAQKLKSVFDNLAKYAEETGLSQKKLIAAQNRAADSLMKQSEHYSLYQKAQDALLSPQQKLADAFANIEKEAKQWKWGEEVVSKMKEMKRVEIFGKDAEDYSDETNAEQRKNVSQIRNQALEYGTVAFYESQMKGDKPLLDENKRQTKHLSAIEKALSKTASSSGDNGVNIIA